MSSGAGHILDMMNRMKQNRALRNSQRNKFKNNRDAFLGKDSRGPGINNPQVSEEKLLKIKQEIQKKAQRRKSIFASNSGNMENFNLFLDQHL